LCRRQRCTAAFAASVGDGFAQGLRAVDHDQQPPLGREPPLGQVGERPPADRGVLGGSLPQPERQLRPIGADPECAQAGVAGQLDAVEHQHDQVVGHRAGHELGERLPRAGDEAAGDG
jgi:hypothetical protein